MRKFFESHIDLIFYVLIIAALMVGTYERNRVWLTDIGLWQDCVKKSPNKDRPYNNLGSALMKAKRFPEAKIQLEKAISLGGISQMEANNNLGIILGEENQFSEAFVHFERALKIVPNAWETNNNLGIYKFKSGDNEVALFYIKRALKLNPDSPLVRGNFQKITAAKIKKERGL